jgi:hypothetical protein
VLNKITKQKIPLAYKMPKRIQTNVKVLIKAQKYYNIQKIKGNDKLLDKKISI